MQVEKLRKQFEDRFVEIVYDDEHRPLYTFKDRDTLLAETVWDWFEQKLKEERQKAFKEGITASLDMD